MPDEKEVAEIAALTECFCADSFRFICFHASFSPVIPLDIHWKSVHIQAASAEAAGNITSSFNSWLLMLYPYFLPEYTLSTSGK
jgi:hypothetical protein